MTGGTETRAAGLRDRLRRGLETALLTRRSLRHEIVFATLAIGISTGLRLALDDVLPPGFPFLTYFPAVMLTLVLSSMRSGLVVGAVCGVIAWYAFITPENSLALTPGSVLALAFYALIIGTDVLFISAAKRALRKRQAAELRATALAHARSLMFSELQHRISNNLSTVAALLRLQGQAVADETARQALIAAQTRIRSISMLQRRLHSPDMQMLDGAEYLSAVLRDVVEVTGAGNVDLQVRADPVGLPHDTAVPLGLIASELAMNAIEHGPSADGQVHIAVTLAADAPDRGGATAARLEIADRGPGLPQGFSLERTESLGLIVARQFAVALDGVLDLVTGPRGGAVARLSFRIPPVASDI